MKIRGMILDDAEVAKARKRFRECAKWRSKQRKILLSFGALLRLFADSRNSFADIGKMASKKGTPSREAVRCLYDRYFRPLFPGQPSGRERERLSGEKQHLLTRKMLFNDFSEEPFLAIASSAKAARSVVERIIIKSRLRATNRFIMVDGMRYAVAHVQCVQRYVHSDCKNEYATLSVSRKTLAETEGIVAVQQAEGYPTRVFVVPSAVIIAAYGHRDGERLALAIPVRQYRKYGGTRPRIDWWKFENAWPSLRIPPSSEPAVSPAQPAAAQIQPAL